MRPINWELKFKKGSLRYYLGNHYPNKYLTQRQIEVLLCAPNKSYKEISRQMNLSRRTVEAYLQQVMLRLSIKTKKELSEVILQTNILKELNVMAQKNSEI